MQLPLKPPPTPWAAPPAWPCLESTQKTERILGVAGGLTSRLLPRPSTQSPPAGSTRLSGPVANSQDYLDCVCLFFCAGRAVGHLLHPVLVEVKRTPNRSQCSALQPAASASCHGLHAETRSHRVSEGQHRLQLGLLRNLKGFLRTHSLPGRLLHPSEHQSVERVYRTDLLLHTLRPHPRKPAVWPVSHDRQCCPETLLRAPVKRAHLPRTGHLRQTPLSFFEKNPLHLTAGSWPGDARAAETDAC